jgi:glycerophosphoryl diester phosphodiesterase
LRIGHRGASALVPENTLASFREAVRVGVDLVEFDVLSLRDGALVVAHSHDLREASHGALEGSMREWTLRTLRATCPEIPTLDEALAFFADEASEVGAHVDLKVGDRERDLVAALRGRGLVERALVSSFDPRSTRTLSLLDDRLRVGITVPRSVLGITEDSRAPWLARGGLAGLRYAIPPATGSILAVARASALVLHHSVVTAAVVRRAHARGAAVVTWTVDDRDELERVEAAGVDAIVTNDPRIFASTLETP